MKVLPSRPTTGQRRTVRHRAVIGLAAAILTLAATVVIAFAWYLHESSGPGYDADLAASSLRRVLIHSRPVERLDEVHCDGLRDGSDFFSCEVSRQGKPVESYSVTYNAATHLYRTGGGATTAVFEFGPSE